MAHSRVMARASDLIAGAANNTTGNIITQAINHEENQFCTKWPAALDGRLAMPAAMKQVNPDWITPNTK